MWRIAKISLIGFPVLVLLLIAVAVVGWYWPYLTFRMQPGLRKTVRGDSDSVYDIAISPDGKLVVTGGSGSVGWSGTNRRGRSLCFWRLD